MAKGVIHASIEADGLRTSRPAEARGARSGSTVEPEPSARLCGRATGDEQEGTNNGGTLHSTPSYERAYCDDERRANNDDERTHSVDTQRGTLNIKLEAQIVAWSEPTARKTASLGSAATRIRTRTVEQSSGR